MAGEKRLGKRSEGRSRPWDLRATHGPSACLSDMESWEVLCRESRDCRGRTGRAGTETSGGQQASRVRPKRKRAQAWRRGRWKLDGGVAPPPVFLLEGTAVCLVFPSVWICVRGLHTLCDAGSCSLSPCQPRGCGVATPSGKLCPFSGRVEQACVGSVGLSVLRVCISERECAHASVG